MPAYKNFYETLKEAEMRLLHTVVLYDGEPYYVIAITDHKPDGIFRVYLDAIDHEHGLTINRFMGKNDWVPYEWHQGTPSDPSRGQKMDEWLDKHPKEGIIRKMINSPAFNKFRPFELGMCNHNGRVMYVERHPTRHTQQGLTQNMLYYHRVSLDAANRPAVGVDFVSQAMYDTIKGNYPSIGECITNLLDPEIENEAVAFHRKFALIRGPVDTLFLAYKGDVIGILPHNDLSCVNLAKKFKYTKEVVEDLKVFDTIKTV